MDFLHQSGIKKTTQRLGFVVALYTNPFSTPDFTSCYLKVPGRNSSGAGKLKLVIK
jgi:hypothetical protein